MQHEDGRLEQSIEAGSSLLRTVVVTFVTVIGNVLVWFDLALFGFFTPQIAKTFFPASSPNVALLFTLAAFAVSFIVRPFGSYVLGAYADRAGRRSALLLSILLVFFGTATIALMPSFEAIGWIAPVGVLLSRMLQGFAAGGEYGAATAYLAELTDSRRGLITSLQTASQSISGMMAAASGLLLSTFLSPAELDSWGWRLPFLFGLLVAPIGLYLRARMRDDHSDPRSGTGVPIHQALIADPIRLGAATCMLAVGTSSTYMLSYLPTYAERHAGIPSGVMYVAVFTAFLLQMLLAPVMGYLSDRAGRPLVLGLSAVVIGATCFPIFSLLVSEQYALVVVLAISWLAICKSAYSGPLPAMLADTFPKSVRATGIAVSYNSGVAIFGGTAPLIMEAVGSLTGSHYGPPIYLALTASISLSSIWILRSRAFWKTNA